MLPVAGFDELGGKGAGDGGGDGPVLEAEEADDGLELDVAYARVDEVLGGVVVVGLHPVAVVAVGLPEPGSSH